MQRAARIRRGCVWALVGVAVVIALVPWQGIIWDGGFPATECRLKFVDSEGKPVPGVTLTVFTKTGGVCHYYPIDEFVPNKQVVSDGEGRMVFHHTPVFLEYSGHVSSNLIGMRFGETEAPHYECGFTHQGREVFRTKYNFYRSGWAEFRKPDVTRTWKPPWDTPGVGRGKPEEFNAFYERSFDTNHDGKFDREEIVARRWFQWKVLFENEEMVIKYQAVERTIVIPNP